MSKYVAAGALGTLVVALSSGLGCDALVGLLKPTSVNVRVVNNGTFPVSSTFYIAEDSDILDVLITTFGTQIENTVDAGQSLSFTRSCNDLGAIQLREADLQVVGSIGPETDTNILREGEDFSCGDTIVFTFTNTELPLDLNVTVTIEPFSLSTGG